MGPVVRPEAEAFLIAAGTAAATGTAGLVGVLVVGRRSARAAALMAPVVPVLAVAAALVVSGRSMFLAEQDLTLLAWIVVAALPFALLFGILAARRLDRQVRAAAEASAALEASQELERRRREMVTWISHDLRTPLAGMRAMTEALEDGVAPEPDRYLRQLRGEVDHLSRMVDDLLALSRLQSGAIERHRDVVDLRDVLSDTLASAEPLARERGVRLEGSAEEKCEVWADGRDLGRAVTNLIGNAVRHTAAGSRVVVEAAARAGTVTITVTDECGGIPDADLERLFEPGWRGSAARTPGGGTGLGLAVVQEIVSAHGGTVSVANTSSGCAFTVTLPRENVPSAGSYSTGPSAGG